MTSASELPPTDDLDEIALGLPIGTYGSRARRPGDDVLHLQRYGTAS